MLYDAGVDVYQGDPLGRLSLSLAGLAEGRPLVEGAAYRVRLFDPKLGHWTEMVLDEMVPVEVTGYGLILAHGLSKRLWSESSLWPEPSL